MSPTSSKGEESKRRQEDVVSHGWVVGGMRGGW